MNLLERFACGSANYKDDGYGDEMEFENGIELYPKEQTSKNWHLNLYPFEAINFNKQIQ